MGGHPDRRGPGRHARVHDARQYEPGDHLQLLADQPTRDRLRSDPDHSLLGPSVRARQRVRIPVRGGAGLRHDHARVTENGRSRRRLESPLARDAEGAKRPARGGGRGRRLRGGPPEPSDDGGRRESSDLDAESDLGRVGVASALLPASDGLDETDAVVIVRRDVVLSNAPRDEAATPPPRRAPPPPPPPPRGEKWLRSRAPAWTGGCVPPQELRWRGRAARE